MTISSILPTTRFHEMFTSRQSSAARNLLTALPTARSRRDNRLNLESLQRDYARHFAPDERPPPLLSQIRRRRLFNGTRRRRRPRETHVLTRSREARFSLRIRPRRHVLFRNRLHHIATIAILEVPNERTSLGTASATYTHRKIFDN